MRRIVIIFAVVALGLSALALWHFRPIGFKLPAFGAEAQPGPADEPAFPASSIPSFSDSEQKPIPAEEAFSRLLTAAEAGSVADMLYVAEFYGQGWGVRQNFTERFQWLQKAAEAGDPQGVYLAAQALELGLGVTADQAAALAGFERAAGLGLPAAHFKLAQVYLETDQVRAAACLEEALAGGLPVAANTLGWLYLHGPGNLAADAGKARSALRRGAELADPEALKNLAVMYKEGWGGPADPVQSLKWYLAAREAGWQGENLEETLAELESRVGEPAARQAEAEARAWLAERRPAASN